MSPAGDRLKGERFTILQMVQDGTITPDEGARLLEAMDRAERMVSIPAPPAPPKTKDVRFIVTNANGQNEVDITLPYGLVEMGLNIANKVAPGRVPDTTEIRKSIQSGFTGSLLNIHNGNDRIEIIVQER